MNDTHVDQETLLFRQNLLLRLDKLQDNYDRIADKLDKKADMSIFERFVDQTIEKDRQINTRLASIEKVQNIIIGMWILGNVIIGILITLKK